MAFRRKIQKYFLALCSFAQSRYIQVSQKGVGQRLIFVLQSFTLHIYHYD